MRQTLTDLWIIKNEIPILAKRIRLTNQEKSLQSIQLINTLLSQIKTDIKKGGNNETH